MRWRRSSRTDKTVMTMDIDAGRVQRLLQSHEARLHRFGWERSPQLLVLYDTAEPETDRLFRLYRTADPHFHVTTRVAGYATKAIITSWPAQPSECLRAMALGLIALGQGIGAPVLELLRRPGVLGVGWADEGWTKVGGRDVVEARIHNNISVRDMPGRKEERILWGLDLQGRLHMVTRARGDRPQIMPRATLFHGGPITMLKMIVAAVTDTVPPRDEWPLAFPDLGDLFEPVGSPLREGNPPCR